jgi:short-subunit dehydrogenase
MSTNPKPTVLITGASGGIGLELATVCAEAGHDLVLVARSHERLKVVADNLAHTYNVKTLAIEQDLTEEGAAEKISKQAAKMEPGILINNAGIGLGGRFDEQEPEKIDALIKLNIQALTDLTRIFLPVFVKRGYGRVLNVASTAAFMPGPFMAVYYASKAYVLSFSQALAEENRTTGVSVTALCPGPTQTHFASEAGMEHSRLFNGEKVMDAKSVARAGYKGMIAGKEVVIPGAGNRLMVGLRRFAPADLAMKMVRREHEDDSSQSSSV